MPDSDSLRITIEGRRATVTLSRPDIRNAFDDGAIAQIDEAFRRLGERDDLRAIVLAAEGAAFCAGADLGWMRRMADYTRDENIADAAHMAAMLRTIDLCPVPTIARIQGDVYAGGLGLVAACDIAVAVDSARFCLSEVRLGLVPATISPYVLRAMGARAARRYALTAERFDAAEALRIGLVHAVTSVDGLDAEVDALARTLADNGSAAMRTTKALLRAVDGQVIDDEILALTAAGIADVRAGEEGREGVQSFLQKRTPAWRGGA